MKSGFVALAGRPNAGKSSLVNAILQDKRTIVSDVAGTTRDAIDIPYTHGDKNYVLIDTAGMRPRSKRDTSVEVFSAMRSEKAIRRSDICLLVIDLSVGVTQQDRRIGSIIAQECKPCIVVVNKFDLYCPDAPLSARKEAAKEHVKENLFFLDYAPVVIVSAKEGRGLEHIFKALARVQKCSLNMPGTGELNRLLQRAMEVNPPGQHRTLKKRLKLFYATAAVNEKYTTIPVPTYVLFVNDKRRHHLPVAVQYPAAPFALLWQVLEVQRHASRHPSIPAPPRIGRARGMVEKPVLALKPLQIQAHFPSGALDVLFVASESIRLGLKNRYHVHVVNPEARFRRVAFLPPRMPL